MDYTYLQRFTRIIILVGSVYVANFAVVLVRELACVPVDNVAVDGDSGSGEVALEGGLDAEMGGFGEHGAAEGWSGLEFQEGYGDCIGRDGVGSDGIGIRRDGIGTDGLRRDGVGRDGIVRDGCIRG